MDEKTRKEIEESAPVMETVMLMTKMLIYIKDYGITKETMFFVLLTLGRHLNHEHYVTYTKYVQFYMTAMGYEIDSNRIDAMFSYVKNNQEALNQEIMDKIKAYADSQDMRSSAVYIDQSMINEVRATPKTD